MDLSFNMPFLLSPPQIQIICCAAVVRNLCAVAFLERLQYQIDCIIEQSPTSFNLA